MRLTMDECVRFLKQCTSAEEVTLGCITNNWLRDLDNEHELQIEAFEREKYSQVIRGGAPVSRNTLQELRRLSLELDGSACDCTLILQFFILSSLRTLRFQNFMTSMESSHKLESLLLRSFGSEAGSRLGDLFLVDHYMKQRILPFFLSLRDTDGTIIPSVSIYLGGIGKSIGIIAEPTLVDNYSQDAYGGTWVERGGLPDSFC